MSFPVTAGWRPMKTTVKYDLPALTSEDYNAEQKRKMNRRQSSKALVDSLDLESKGSLDMLLMV